MIYTASYFHPEHRHGQALSISRSMPKGAKVDDEIDCFKPSKDLLKWWEHTGEALKDWKTYTQKYFEEIDKEAVEQWLTPFSNRLQRPDFDMTLLCWEEPGDHCHRNLVLKAIQKRLPWLAGGADVPLLKVGDLVDWPSQDGGNLDWIKPFRVKRVEGQYAWLDWVDGAVNIVGLRVHGK